MSVECSIALLSGLTGQQLQNLEKGGFLRAFHDVLGRACVQAEAGVVVQPVPLLTEWLTSQSPSRHCDRRTAAERPGGGKFGSGLDDADRAAQAQATEFFADDGPPPGAVLETLREMTLRRPDDFVLCGCGGCGAITSDFAAHVQVCVYL